MSERPFSPESQPIPFPSAEVRSLNRRVKAEQAVDRRRFEARKEEISMPRPDQFASASPSRQKRDVYRASEREQAMHLRGELPTAEEKNRARPFAKRTPSPAPESRWQPLAEAEPIWSSERPSIFHADPDAWSDRADEQRKDFREYAATDRRFDSSLEELNELDRLASRLSSRRAVRLEGVQEPGRRRRDDSRAHERMSPLRAPGAEYERREASLDAQKRDLLADARSTSISSGEDAWAARKKIENQVNADFQQAMASLEDIPTLAAREHKQRQLDAYRDAQFKARTRGRYPARKPIVPFRDGRRELAENERRMFDGGGSDTAQQNRFDAAESELDQALGLMKPSIDRDESVFNEKALGRYWSQTDLDDETDLDRRLKSQAEARVFDIANENASLSSAYDVTPSGKTRSLWIDNPDNSAIAGRHGFDPLEDPHPRKTAALRGEEEDTSHWSVRDINESADDWLKNHGTLPEDTSGLYVPRRRSSALDDVSPFAD